MVVILYEMLASGAPFTGGIPVAVTVRQVAEPTRPPREIVPSIPEELERVVLHALAKNPAARPPNASELRRELHTIAEELGLEHADSAITPSLDALRSAGTESPSGRLVIDLATLRHVQAAGSGER